MEPDSPQSRHAVRPGDLGEGGTIATPAAITNAVNDALRGLGLELLESPVTPRRVVEAIRAGRGGH